MTIAIILSLFSGIAFGYLFRDANFITYFPIYSKFILYLLMLSVGVSVGGNKLIFKKLKEYNLKIILIPSGIIIGSIVGGVICALVLGNTLSEGMSIASGMGWYSLSGVMLSELINPEIGSIAFLSNILREILSFVSIPFIVKHLNVYCAIAPAGATSEDTTLPILLKHCGEDIAVIAVLNGLICSSFVPILINIFAA